MDLLLTEAAKRALHEAACWTFTPASDQVEAPALLLGLLAESECRAALCLTRHGVDEPLVRAQWPTLTRADNRQLQWAAAGPPQDTVPATANAPAQIVAVRGPSYELKLSINAALARLKHLPEPVPLATEHLLLGLTAIDHDVGEWLRSHGVAPDELLAEAYRQHGLAPPNRRQDPQPLAWPDDASPPAAASRFDADAIAAAPPPPLPESCAGDDTALLRILDAAADRAREGLRVVEDYVRFVLDDRHLSGLLKGLRHELTALVERFDWHGRVRSRDTLGDVGTTLSTQSETVRLGAEEVVRANFARLQEALRSLEEFGKILDATAAAGFERLRYRAYTLEKAVYATGVSLRRLATARLYVLVDGGPDVAHFESRLAAIVAAGADVVQLRDKRLDDRTLVDLARRFCRIVREAGAVAIINDRPDLAALAGADGVHVGQEELGVRDARRIVGPHRLVGVSTHGIQQARQAVLHGADYLGAGPTFPSSTKSFAEFPGLDYLRQLAAEIRLPAFAIGGIDTGNLSAVLETGIRRIAVSSAVTATPNPADAVRQLKSLLNAAPTP